jgi:hypothetical protein
MTDKIYAYGTRTSINRHLTELGSLDGRIYKGKNSFDWINSEHWPDGAIISLYTLVVNGFPQATEHHGWDAKLKRLK